MGKRKSRALPKKYKWMARQKGQKFWYYFTAKKRAIAWAGPDGVVKKRYFRKKKR